MSNGGAGAPRLAVVESLSVGTGTPNEDRAGQACFTSGVSTAWVLDGATGLAAREWVPEGPTDAAWLAEHLTHLLAETDPERLPPRRYFETVLSRVAAAYHAAVPDWQRLPSWALPSAAGIWLRLAGGSLEIAWQGDCVAVVEHAAGIVLLGAEAERAWEDDINAVVRAHLAATPSPRARIMDDVMDELRRRRGRLNQPGGYWMLGVDPRAAAAMDVRTLALDRPTRVLLASDGLWRLVDHFGRYDAAGLLHAAFAQGVAALIAELRCLEDDDCDCRRVPRVKPSDDATGLTLIAGPG